MRTATFRLIGFALLLLGLLTVPVTAQDGPGDAAGTPPATPPTAPAVAAPSGLSSPSETLGTFLEAMNQDPPDRDAGAACLDQTGIDPAIAADLAQRLYRILNRLEMIDLDEHPGGADAPLDAATTRYVFFPRPTEDIPIQFGRISRPMQVRMMASEAGLEPLIALELGADAGWRFSADTVTGIDALYEVVRALIPVGDFEGEKFRTISEQIEDLWPRPFVDGAILGVKYWQWIVLFGLILIGVFVDFFTRFALSAIARRAIQRRGGEARRDSIQKTVRPFGLVAGALTWVGLLHIVGLPAVALSIVLIAVRLFAMLAIVWAAFRLTDLVSEVFLNKAEKTESRFDDLLIPLVRKAVKVLIFVFGIIFVGRSIPGANLTPLFTGIGIGGAGFAFAAKDTLEHFFGSLTVLADRPFQVGDWVQIGEVEGTVEEVGFRSTRIRTFYNSLITLPNGNLVRAAVDNYGQRKYRRWSTHLNLTYDTPPDKIEAFCEGVRELIRVHPYTRKDYYQVWLHKFGAHSLDVLLYVFHEAPDWQTELRERHRLAIDIIRLANRLGVEFAFPTQTIHLGHEAQEPVTLGDPPANADGRAGLEGRKAVRELTQEASWRREKPGPYKFEFASHADADDETQIESKPGGQDGGG